MNGYYRKPETLLKAKKGKSKQKTCFSLDKRIRTVENVDARSVLRKLEGDHRNLVRHCLVMEEDIKYREIYVGIIRNRWNILRR